LKKNNQHGDKNHLQPALLYLSPACILSVVITALVRGELKELFAYSPNTAASKEETKKDN